MPRPYWKAPIKEKCFMSNKIPFIATEALHPCCSLKNREHTAPLIHFKGCEIKRFQRDVQGVERREARMAKGSSEW